MNAANSPVAVVGGAVLSLIAPSEEKSSDGEDVTTESDSSSLNVENSELAGASVVVPSVSSTTAAVDGRRFKVLKKLL